MGPMIISELEQRLQTLSITRVYDQSTLSNLESLLQECSNQLQCLVTSSDSTQVALLLPSLLQVIISLSKHCSEKSDLITPGPYLTKENLASLINMAKVSHNQVKEYIKSPQLNVILSRSTEQRGFCEQLRRVSDSVANVDPVITLICHKLIVKLLTGSGDEQQQSQRSVKMDDANDGLIAAVVGSVLQQMSMLCAKNLREKVDGNRESPTIKLYSIYLQMLSKLIQHPQTVSQLDSYRAFIRIMIQLHQCLELTCQHALFQLQFFNNTILLQEVLQEFLLYALSQSSKTFFDDLSVELGSSGSKYASLIFLFRCIEALDVSLTKQNNDLALHWMNQLISPVFDLIDQCQCQLVLPALLPVSFGKTQVEYGSLYDITYSLLMKLLAHEPMQVLLSSMTQLIQPPKESLETLSILSTSIQLASELIIQSYLLYHLSSQFQELFALFLAELLRADLHTSLVQHLFTMPNIRTVKFRAYEALISSSSFSRVYDLFSSFSTGHSRPSAISPSNLPLIFPSHIDHLYPFVRLFQNELNPQQVQHTLDTCLYSIQQFLSLPVLTDSTCRTFLLTLRLLTYVSVTSNQESFKCLLGQLTQIFVVVDEQAAADVRLELLHLFAVHCNQLEENDLGRILDFMLTNPVESSSSSVAFHLACLDVLDALRQRPSRGVQITDLVIQSLVRYGNEHQASHLLKAHLMRIFMSYITQSNENSLPMRVKSQCALLRANVDEFVKNKKTPGGIPITTLEHFPDQQSLQSTRALAKSSQSMIEYDEGDIQLQFFRTLLSEVEAQPCSPPPSNPQAMQQD